MGDNIDYQTQSGENFFQVITLHEVYIAVEKSVIKAALMNNKRDMIMQVMQINKFMDY